MAMLSLSRSDSLKVEAAENLLESSSTLAEACPEDNLLASVTYLILVLPLLIFNNEQGHFCHVPWLCRK